MEFGKRSIFLLKKKTLLQELFSDELLIEHILVIRRVVSFMSSWPAGSSDVMQHLLTTALLLGVLL